MRQGRAARTLLVLCLGLASCADNDHQETPGSKAEWALLQGLEYEGRHQIPAAPHEVDAEGRAVLTLPSLDGKQRLWILLSPAYPPYYKQLPQGNYTLAPELVDGLARSGKLSSTVEAVLRSHVERR